MLICVASCKSYSDAWTPFATLFERFWPDCPYRKVLFSDKPEVMPEIGGLEFQDIADEGWIQNLWKMLVGPAHGSEVVLLLQEDFFLCYPVDQPRIARILEWFEKSDYAICRLYPLGYDTDAEIFPGICELQADAPYRASCQASLWKRDRLMELCRRVLGAGGKSPTDFEITGSPLIRDFKVCGWMRRGHPSTWALAYQCTAISWGKWMSGAVGFCLDQGIVLNPKRQIMWSGDQEADNALNERYKKAVYG